MQSKSRVLLFSLIIPLILAAFCCAVFMPAGETVYADSVNVTVSVTTGGQIYGAEILGEITILISGLDDEGEIARLHSLIGTRIEGFGEVGSASVGRYTVLLTYNGEIDLEPYNFIFIDGIYEVSPAQITGYSLPDASVAYDGENHSLIVESDENATEGVQISYSNNSHSAVGSYIVTATLTCENFEPLILDARLFILGNSLSDKNDDWDISVLLDSGYFLPRAAILFTHYSDFTLQQDINDLIDSETDGKKRAVVLGFYSLHFTFDAMDATAADGNYTVRLKLESLTNADDILIIRTDGDTRSTEYTFEDGYFIFEANGDFQIAFVKEVSTVVTGRDGLVWTIIIGAIVLLIIVALLFSGDGARRRNKRYRRQHSRYA